MEYLQIQGVMFGEDGMSHTNGNHRRNYYLTETKKNMWLLSEFRRRCNT